MQTHTATSDSLQEQLEQKAIMLGNNAFEGLLTAAAPISDSIGCQHQKAVS